MKIAITQKDNLSKRLAALMRLAILGQDEELILFATKDSADKMAKLLRSNGKITEIYVSDKTIYITDGLKVQIEIIDGYE